MKQGVLVLGALFAVALAVVIGVRLSADAMAVVVGIVCGMVASIPTSAILVWVLRVKERQLEAESRGLRGYGGYPPVVVVNGQGSAGAGAGPPVLPAGNGHGRTFKVVGQENTESKGDLLPPFWDEV